MDASAKKIYGVVIVIVAMYAVMYLLTKAVFDGGMNCLVFIFYRQAAATVVMLPLSFFLERKNLPHLSFVTVCKIFLISFFGMTLSLVSNGVALVYTSANLAAATTNTLPVITFVLALVLGMEALRLKTKPGLAKLTGMVVCVGGVAFLAFFKGPHFRSHWHLIHSSFGQTKSVDYHHSSINNWVTGCFLMLLSNFFWALWLVSQGQILKSYPSKLLSTTLQGLFSTIQSFGIAIAFERSPSQWKLAFDFRLLVIGYCGILVTGVTFWLQSWVIEKRGPVFLAMWTPVILVITMLISSIFLGQIITLGSIVGGGLLILGLYSVLWGKSKEHQQKSDQTCVPELKQIKLVHNIIENHTKDHRRSSQDQPKV